MFKETLKKIDKWVSVKMKKLRLCMLKNLAILIMMISVCSQPHKIQRMSEEIQLEEKKVEK